MMITIVGLKMGALRAEHIGAVFAFDGKVPDYTVLCCTVLYYTILYYTILYYTILYCIGGKVPEAAWPDLCVSAETRNR